ncbi:MAG: hypothetical protein AB1640_00235 [bacterium]
MRARVVTHASGVLAVAALLALASAAAGESPSKTVEPTVERFPSRSSGTAAAEAKPDPALLQDLTGDVSAACEGLAKLASECPGATLQRGDGMFIDEVGGRERIGCCLMIRGSFAALRGAPDVAERLHDSLPSRGWKEELRYAADGPDGTMFGMRKGSVLCVVKGRWNGGDDEDPSYAPSDLYEVTVDCAAD